jgi:hypothetical protein
MYFLKVKGPPRTMFMFMFMFMFTTYLCLEVGSGKKLNIIQNDDDNDNFTVAHIPRQFLSTPLAQ